MVLLHARTIGRDLEIRVLRGLENLAGREEGLATVVGEDGQLVGAHRSQSARCGITLAPDGTIHRIPFRCGPVTGHHADVLFIQPGSHPDASRT
ncbi:hypothetical protein D3C80_1862380 [compost metagenome]